MSHLHVIFHDVSFTYDTAAVPLLAGVSVHFPRGWTGIVGANGAGKTTLLRLATGELAPSVGRSTRLARRSIARNGPMHRLHFLQSFC